MRRRLNILLKEHRYAAMLRRKEEAERKRVLLLNEARKNGTPICLFCKERPCSFGIRPLRWKKKMRIVGFWCECREYHNTLQFHFVDANSADNFFYSVDPYDLFEKQTTYRVWWLTTPGPSMAAGLGYWGHDYTERLMQLPPYYERVTCGKIKAGDLFHAYPGASHWSPGFLLAMPDGDPVGNTVSSQMVVARPDNQFKQLTMRF